MKINKNIMIHASLLISLLIYVSYVFFKFNPSIQHFIYHSVYICQSYLQYIPLFILLFVVITFIYAAFQFIVSHYKTYTFKRDLKYEPHIPSRIKKIENQFDLKNKIQILSDYKPRAFCMGIFFPKIYLSTGLLHMINGKELNAIILHEKYHITHRDNLVLVCLHFLRNLLFFFPFAHDIVNYFELKEEMSADEEAIRKLGDHTFIISALKKMLTFEDTTQYSFAFAKANHIEARINNLVGKPSKPVSLSIKNVILSVFSFLFITVLFQVPVMTTEIHAQGKDVVMMCFGNQSCDYMCKQNQSLYTPAMPFSKAN